MTYALAARPLLAGRYCLGTISILAGAWLSLSLLTTVVLASIAARGHVRREDKRRQASEARY